MTAEQRRLRADVIFENGHPRIDSIGNRQGIGPPFPDHQIGRGLIARNLLEIVEDAENDPDGQSEKQQRFASPKNRQQSRPG